MDKGLAQILGARAPLCMLHGDAVPGPVVRDDASVIYGKVGGLLFEVGHRIAARLHDFAEKPVGFAYRPVGVVDKPRLHGRPAPGVALPRSGIERADVVAPDAFLDGLQLCLAP